MEVLTQEQVLQVEMLRVSLKVVMEEQLVTVLVLVVMVVTPLLMA